MNQNIIGLDIGGTKITGIVFDGKKIVRELTVPTPKTLSKFQEAVRKLVGFLSAGRSISALGVGQAGIVNDNTGVVVTGSVHTIKYLPGFNVRKFYENLGIKKVKIENDSHCFSLAELYAGKGKGYRNFVGVTLGTSIGGGIILNKELYRGSHRGAGHVSYVMADLIHTSSYFYKKFRDKKDYKKLGETVGILLANIINVLDVEAIILGGSVGVLWNKKFLPKALAVAKKHVVNTKAMPKVLVSSLKNSGALGAALLFTDK